MRPEVPEAVLRFEVEVRPGTGVRCYVEVDGKTVGELCLMADPRLELSRHPSVWHIAVPSALGESDAPGFVTRSLAVLGSKVA